MGVGLNGESESAGKTEVSELDVLAHRVDEQVLRLQVSVENAVLVQVNERLQDLVEEALCLFAG